MGSETPWYRIAGALLALLVGSPLAAPAAPDFDAAARDARALLEELVAADTSNPPGNEARAVAIGRRRLDAVGIAHRTSTFGPGRDNLVARLSGSGARRPLLLLAHSDVVGAAGQDWSTDPHRLTETDGFLQARGVADDLGMAAVELVVLLLLHAEGVPLARDVILAWTGDEESGGAGIQWILEHEPESIEAEVVINEGGGIRLGDDGQPEWIQLQAAEKIYRDFELRTTGPTGHSSVPLADNAIVRLARALARLSEHEFPVRVLPVLRAHLGARAEIEGGERGRAMRAVAGAGGAPPADALALLLEDPLLAASLRTTCVATEIQGGTRANALPADARATLNCRILPDRPPEEVEAELVRIIDDPRVEVRESNDFSFGPPSPLDAPAPEAIARVADSMWPGIRVIPYMSRGATDSRFLRARGMAAYGISPIAIPEADARRAHGIDERIPAESLRPAVEFLYRLVVEIAGPGVSDR